MEWQFKRTKTKLLQINQRGNKESCEQRRRVVVVPVVVEPVVAPVPLAIIEIEATDIEVASGIAEYIECCLRHRPLSTFRAEFYP
jgi:hypothetical protein